MRKLLGFEDTIAIKVTPLSRWIQVYLNHMRIFLYWK